MKHHQILCTLTVCLLTIVLSVGCVSQTPQNRPADLTKGAERLRQLAGHDRPPRLAIPTGMEFESLSAASNPARSPLLNSSGGFSNRAWVSQLNLQLKGADGADRLFEDLVRNGCVKAVGIVPASGDSEKDGVRHYHVRGWFTGLDDLKSALENALQRATNGDGVISPERLSFIGAIVRVVPPTEGFVEVVLHSKAPASVRVTEVGTNTAGLTSATVGGVNPIKPASPASVAALTTVEETGGDELGAPGAVIIVSIVLVGILGIAFLIGLLMLKIAKLLRRRLMTRCTSPAGS